MPGSCARRCTCMTWRRREGIARGGGHLRGRDGHRMLLRSGENAGEGAGEDGLVRAQTISSSTRTAPPPPAGLRPPPPRARSPRPRVARDPHLHLHRLDADQRLAGRDRIARPSPHFATTPATGRRRGAVAGRAARPRRTGLSEDGGVADDQGRASTITAPLGGARRRAGAARLSIS